MKKFFTLLLLLSTNFTHADTAANMKDAFTSVINLTPYYVSEAKFTDPKNKEYIYSNISNLDAVFNNLKHDKLLNTVQFGSTLKIIKSHIKETKDSFNSGNVHFSRNRMKSTIPLCINCHSQIKTKASNEMFSSLKSKSSQIKNNFEKAEIFLLLRDYKSAEVYYNKYIKDFLEKEQSFRKYSDIEYLPYKNIITSFKRVLSIHLKTNYKPGKALKFLDKYAKNKSISKSLREDIAKWKKGVQSLIGLKIESIGQMEKALISNANEIKNLVIYGKLNRLQAEINTPEVKAKSLYMLAKIDRTLNFSYFYSMADMYLETCMENYSKTSYAKKCLEEYKEQMNHGYTGSAGFSLPEDIKKKIRSFEKKVK